MTIERHCLVQLLVKFVSNISLIKNFFKNLVFVKKTPEFLYFLKWNKDRGCGCCNCLFVFDLAKQKLFSFLNRSFSKKNIFSRIKETKKVLGKTCNPRHCGKNGKKQFVSISFAWQGCKNWPEKKNQSWLRKYGIGSSFFCHTKKLFQNR